MKSNFSSIPLKEREIGVKMIKKHFSYLKYVLSHKWFVLIKCFEEGLYWRGIVHDWAKFLPSEWFPYVENFYGNSAAAEKRFELAWHEHIRLSDHHWEYWMIGRLPIPMCDNAMLEMLCDWYGAGMAKNKNKNGSWSETYEFFKYHIENGSIVLHPDTISKIDKFLFMKLT